MRIQPCVCATAFFMLGSLSAYSQPLPLIADRTSSMVAKDGFFPVYWEEATGRVYLKVAQFNYDFLYVSSLSAGLGSNDIGLDRGQLGATRIVRFERVGRKVFLVMPNLRYRAGSDNVAERASVREAFAEGVVWGFTVEAETDGSVLIDVTDFVVRDAHAVTRRLREKNQGNFSLDESRSAPVPEILKAFPDNTELEARITLVGDNPGTFVRNVAADPYALTLRVRHSLIRLPNAEYTPRTFHPAAGYIGLSFRDYAVPIGEDMVQRYIRRHRLAKKDSTAVVSDPIEPIVYYLDPGVPEPVRGALLDGARWWADAFLAAGFSNAFRVEMLPPEADPMDIRYNAIQWIHRSTRGWSYGSTVTDPRTGEIIKGHVSLGSLRVRQNYLIAEGLLAPYADSASTGPSSSDSDPMLQMALARLRQLAAHEVGHTLGLSHNFAASINNRASVMDYPAPYATVDADGRVILDKAYADGIGTWDKVAIAYGYMQPESGVDETQMLAGIMENARQSGLHFLTDADARPQGAAHPLANLWDNGNDMVSALDHEMRVRRAALARFGQAAVRQGQPLAIMEEALVPLYLRHQYQIEATVKLIGGVTYSYSLRGDTLPVPQSVPGIVQRAALTELMKTLHPEALRLPDNIRTQIPPRPPAYEQHRELFTGHTGLTFDPYAPAAAVAGLVLGLTIHPERAARTAYQNDFDPSLPNLEEILETVSSATWGHPVSRNSYDAELQRVVQRVWIDELVGLSANEQAAPAVQAMATQKLRDIHGWLQDNPGRNRDEETLAHRALVLDQIDRYLFRDYQPDEGTVPAVMPPGPPIGQPGAEYRRRQREALLQGMHSAACNEQL